MFDSVWEDIKGEFRHGNVVTRLIIVNLAVFVVVRLTALVFFFIYGKGGEAIFMDKVLNPWFCGSYEWQHILLKPWTLFTYMFLHYGLWHIVLNMLFLYWFGRILKDLVGQDRIFALYVYGALVGFTAFVIVANIFPHMFPVPYILGASAGVIAILIAAATFAPDYSLHLLFIGPVKLKYIALVLILLYLIALPGDNTGGQIAHLGGAFMGWFFVYQLREKGNDLSIPFNNVIDKITGLWERRKDIFSRRKKPRVVYKNTTGKRAKGNAKSDLHVVPDQSEIDAILDKIKRSGYDSLTKEELEILARASKN